MCAQTIAPKVLVLEDEGLIGMLLEEMLLDLGYDATVKTSIDEALAVVESTPLAAAILDLNIGGELSYPVAEALAARDVAFFFVTGYRELQIEARYRERPICNKPFTIADIRGALERARAQEKSARGRCETIPRHGRGGSPLGGGGPRRADQGQLSRHRASLRAARRVDRKALQALAVACGPELRPGARPAFPAILPLKVNCPTRSACR